METAPRDGTWIEIESDQATIIKVQWAYHRKALTSDSFYWVAKENRILVSTPTHWRPLAPAPAPEGRGETPVAVQPIEYLTRYTCSVNGMVPAEDGPWVSFRQAKAAQDEVRESANYWNQQWNKQTGERDAAVACETKIRQYITEAMGHEACEGCDTPQLVAILISQRDNARNESDALKTAHASASRCARAAEAIELRKQLETKEQHRQYHMNAINRLAKVVGAEGEQSEDVVSVAVAAVAQARALREGLTRLVAFKFELFEDGLSADLHDEGIEGASAGYLRGIQDACDELKAIAAAAPRGIGGGEMSEELKRIRKEAFDGLRALNCHRPDVLAELDRLESGNTSEPWPWWKTIIGIIATLSLLTWIIYIIRIA